MAQTKKNTNRKKSSGSQKSGTSKAAARQPKQEPLGPGMTGPGFRSIIVLVLFLLGIYGIIGYFDLGETGTAVQAMCNLFKGLFGWGFCIAPPLLILASIMLYIRLDSPWAVWRSAALLMVILIFGAATHLIAGAENVTEPLWDTGMNLKSGGILAGGLSNLLVRLLSVAGTWVLLVIGLLLLICIAFRVGFRKIISGLRDSYLAGSRERAEARAEQAEIRRADRAEIRKAERAARMDEQRIREQERRQAREEENRRQAEERKKREEQLKASQSQQAAGRTPVSGSSGRTAAGSSTGKKAYDQFRDKAPGDLAAGTPIDTKAGSGYYTGAPGVPNPAELLRQEQEKTAAAAAATAATAAAAASAATDDLQRREFDRYQKAAAERNDRIRQNGAKGKAGESNRNRAPVQPQPLHAEESGQLTFVKDEGTVPVEDGYDEPMAPAVSDHTEEANPFEFRPEDLPPIEGIEDEPAADTVHGTAYPTEEEADEEDIFPDPVFPPVRKPAVPVTPAPAPTPASAPAPAPREYERDEAIPAPVFAKDKKSEPIPTFTPDDREEDSAAYVFPPLDLLHPAVKSTNLDAAAEARAASTRLEDAFRSFGVNLTVSNYTRGPNVTRYEAEIEAGTKLSKLTNLEDDIALALGSTGVRIAAVPNKAATVGIEVPNSSVSTVYLREIIESENFQGAKSKLTFALGKSIAGEAEVGNISKLPHLLIAGTTGSGKSVCLNSLILSLLYKASPEEVKFIMVDPKMVEFKIYNGIPHLMSPVVTEPKKAAGALQWAVVEMMKRYRYFSEENTRDIDSYNLLVAERRRQNPDTEARVLPRVVIIIDELADLMMVAAKEVEDSICRIAQMGRAAGMHLVVATQSPRADVITGLIKANIPSRCALKVSSSLESRIILDSGGGAEKLIGNGDMLYSPTGSNKPKRIQGTWVSDEEREEVINFVKSNCEGAEYNDEMIQEVNRLAEGKNGSKAESGGSGESADSSDNPFADYDEVLPEAVDVALDAGQVSVSMLQRRLKLGYSRAARVVDQMEELGVIGPYEGAKPRQVRISRAQWQEMQMIQGTAPIDSVPSDDSAVFPDYEAGDVPPESYPSYDE